MTLRARLAVAFALVVLLPVALGIAIVGRTVPTTLRGQATTELNASWSAASALVDQLCSNARLAAELLGREATATGAAAATRDVVQRKVADYAVVVDTHGTVVSAGSLPGHPGTVRPAELGSCSGGGSPGLGGVIADTVTLRTSKGAAAGSAAVAYALGRGTVQRLAKVSPSPVTLVRDGRVVASELDPAAARSVAAAATRAGPGGHPVTAGDGRLVEVVQASDPGTLLVVSVSPRSVGHLTLLLALIALGALVLAGVLAWQLSGISTRPLAQLSDAAARVAGGDLDAHLEVSPRSRDELARLARAFNEMTAALRSSISALRTSRDELRRNLSRLGDTLSSTHDLGGILTVVLETAMAATNASAGSVMLTAAGRDDLYVKVHRGLEARGLPPSARVRFGEGAAGHVARSGEPLMGRFGGELQRATGEPLAQSVIAVPLRSSGHVIGVLNLYDRQDARAFDDGDLQTIRSFANQASVAVDNVLLHQEAQRLSITDGLTGLWNYRYFTMSLTREIERSSRFGRPLALLLLDLDHFKQVNDRYGHQRGDAVLVELAARVRSQIREVDVLARYGGEEFVLLLPETDAGGAGQAAERLGRVVRERPFTGEGASPLPITVSIGVAVYPVHTTSPSTLVRAADEALYAAKGAGRDRWVLATGAAPTPGERLPGRADIGVEGDRG